jgi:hypothetical protein
MRRLAELKWARGFLRFWLLASGLWIAAVVMETASDASDIYATASYPFSEQDRWRWGTGDQPPPLPPTTERIVQLRETAIVKARARIAEGVSTALIPPVIAFLVGSSIAWALRGFWPD